MSSRRRSQLSPHQIEAMKGRPAASSTNRSSTLAIRKQPSTCHLISRATQNSHSDRLVQQMHMGVAGVSSKEESRICNVEVLIETSWGDENMTDCAILDTVETLKKCIEVTQEVRERCYKADGKAVRNHAEDRSQPTKEQVSREHRPKVLVTRDHTPSLA